MYVRYVSKNKLGEKIICIKMRRTQEYLHKYPRDVRIGVLESLVQRVPLDNPRDQAERHLGWDWIAGRNQKSLGRAEITRVETNPAIPPSGTRETIIRNRPAWLRALQRPLLSIVKDLLFSFLDEGATLRLSP